VLWATAADVQGEWAFTGTRGADLVSAALKIDSDRTYSYGECHDYSVPCAIARAQPTTGGTWAVWKDSLILLPVGRRDAVYVTVEMNCVGESRLAVAAQPPAAREHYTR
jgi:hypothetical protein